MTPRTAPEPRQFDFWIGHWTVAADGVVAGDSRVESILDGCALLEHWTGASGSRGKSLNAFNPDLDAWEQFWVDNRGQRLLLRGGLRDGAMVLQGVDKGGASRSRQRITWTANTDGTVRQLWESSEDAGMSWSVEFDGVYTRAMDVDRVD